MLKMSDVDCGRVRRNASCHHVLAQDSEHPRLFKGAAAKVDEARKVCGIQVGVLLVALSRVPGMHSFVGAVVEQQRQARRVAVQDGVLKGIEVRLFVALIGTNVSGGDVGAEKLNYLWRLEPFAPLQKFKQRAAMLRVFLVDVFAHSMELGESLLIKQLRLTIHVRHLDSEEEVLQGVVRAIHIRLLWRRRPDA
jgi:hypothetical protein